MYDEKLRQIAQLSLFDTCTRDEIKWIAQFADTLDVGPGAVLSVEGTAVRQFLVIADGAASSEDVVFGPGSFFGELGLLDDRPHTMTIETVAPTRLIVFGLREFRALLHRVPSVSQKLMRELVSRVRVLDQDVRSLRAVS